MVGDSNTWENFARSWPILDGYEFGSLLLLLEGIIWKNNPVPCNPLDSLLDKASMPVRPNPWKVWEVPSILKFMVSCL